MHLACTSASSTDNLKIIIVLNVFVCMVCMLTCVSLAKVFIKITCEDAKYRSSPLLNQPP